MRRNMVMLASVAAIVVLVGATFSLSSAASTQTRGAWGRVKGSGVAASPAMPRDHQGDEELVFITRTVEEVAIDVNGAGETPGDYVVFRDNVFDEGREDLVGRLNVQCFLHFPFRPLRVTLYCEGSLTLVEEGQLTFQGVAVFTQETTEFTLAITGGTGEFETAGGEVHVQFISEEEERLVIHLFD